MQKTVDGKVYERVVMNGHGCINCSARRDGYLCHSLGDCAGYIWKEVTPPAKFKSCELCGAEIAELRERVAKLEAKYQ